MTEIESISIDDNFFQLTKTESGKVIVFVNTPKFTLVPSEYYCKEMRDQYFDFMHLDHSCDVLIENKLPKWNYYILFSLNQNFKTTVEKHYPAAEFYHYATAIASRYTEETISASDLVIINKRNENLYLLISKNNEIVLLNLHLVKSDADLIYFILNGLRKNNINLKSTRLYYSGDIKTEDNSIRLLKKYLVNINPLPLYQTDGNKTSLFEYFRFNPTE